MMKFFRKNIKYSIWLLIVAFLIGSGISLSGMKKEGRFAGEVFGKTVTFQEYNQFYRATQLFMPIEKPFDDPKLLRDYTWQNIIYSREAKHKGIKVADEEVRREIANILKQQGLTHLTPEQYKVWLTHTLHLTPREFEEGLREFMRIQKFLRLQIASLVPPGIDKLTDSKAKEEAAAKQKMDFEAWTGGLNKRAAFKDYFALPEAPQEEPLPAEAKPVQPQSPAAKK